MATSTPRRRIPTAEFQREVEAELLAEPTANSVQIEARLRARGVAASDARVRQVLPGALRQALIASVGRLVGIEEIMDADGQTAAEKCVAVRALVADRNNNTRRSTP